MGELLMAANEFLTTLSKNKISNPNGKVVKGRHKSRPT